MTHPAKDNPNATPSGGEANGPSPDEAERAAAKFRPSWAPPANGAGAPSTSSAGALSPIEARASNPPVHSVEVRAPEVDMPSVIIRDDGPPAPMRPPVEPTERIRFDADDEDPPLPTQRGFGRVKWMVAAAALFVVGSAYWFIATSSTSPAKDAPAPVVAAAPVAVTAREPVVAPPPPAPEPPAPAPTEPEVAAAVAPEAPTPAPEPEPEPAPVRTVHVRVETDPPNAKLTLDGKRITNPYDANIPAGGKASVEATLAGYITARLALALDGERRVELKLKPEKRVVAAPAKRAKPTKAVTKVATKSRTKAKKVAARTKPAAKGTFVSDNPY